MCAQSNTCGQGVAISFEWEAAATAKLAIRVRCASACGVSNRITWSGSAIAAIGMEG